MATYHLPGSWSAEMHCHMVLGTRSLSGMSPGLVSCAHWEGRTSSRLLLAQGWSPPPVSSHVATLSIALCPHFSFLEGPRCYRTRTHPYDGLVTPVKTLRGRIPRHWLLA